MPDTDTDSLPPGEKQVQEHNTYDTTTTATPTVPAGPTDAAYPGPLPLFILLTSVSLACFVVALDRTIVATAIPRITDDFDSPADVGWYASAYLITSCAFQPLYGQIYAKFDIRWTFLLALGLFEVGSLICGVAPSSTVLIVGRAVAGVGCAGVFVGAMVIISVSVELGRRPVMVALVGSIFGLGSVLGPVIGGAFTENVNWRWCFLINLPIGGATLPALLVFFHPPPPDLTASGSLATRVLALDFPGSFLLVTSAVQFLLGLRWGGVTYPWASPQVTGLLCGAAVELLVFLWWEKKKGMGALVPLAVLGQRSVAAALGESFFLSGAMIVHAYFLPMWFQAVRGDSAIASGIHLVPYVVALFVFSVVAGVMVTRTGFYNPPALLGPVISVIGCGLLTTLKMDTSVGKWVGYQILAGGGIGAANQQGYVAIQAVLPPAQASTGSALVLFAQSLAGAIFASVGNNVLRNELLRGFLRQDIPGVDIQRVLDAGATNMRLVVPPGSLTLVLEVFNEALSRIFIVAIPLAGMAFFCGLGLKWVDIRRVKKDDVHAV